MDLWVGIGHCKTAVMEEFLRMTHQSKYTYIYIFFLHVVYKKTYTILVSTECQKVIMYGTLWTELQYDDCVATFELIYLHVLPLKQEKKKVQMISALNIEPFHVCAHQKCKVSMDVLNAWKLLTCLKERNYMLCFLKSILMMKSNRQRHGFMQI